MAASGADPAGVLAYNNDETQQYLEAKGVGTLMCAVLKEVVTTKPEDPIRCAFAANRAKRANGAAARGRQARRKRSGWHARGPGR